MRQWRTRALRWFGGMSIAVALSVPRLAAADTSGLIDAPTAVLEAERLGEQAFEAYSRKQYREAVALYEHAYAIAPSADALYNIARVYDLGLRDRKNAIAAYRRFLAEPGAPGERLERASERMSELLRAERADVSETAPPRAPAVAAEPAPSAPLPTREREPVSSLSPLRVGALVVGGVGVASAAVGGAFGLSVLFNADTANAACEGNRCGTQQGVDAAKTASSHATLATAGVCVGAALMATGAVLWIVGGDAPAEPELAPERAPSASLRMAPMASSRELGLTLVGGW